MISKEVLIDIGKLKGLTNIGYMEKDYIQEILLLLIYRNFNFLVFKGGTCIYKFHKLPRFSEDLDFSALQEFDQDYFFQTIKAGLEKFAFSIVKIEPKKVQNSLLSKLRVAGPLYTGSPLSLCLVRLDINLKSEVLHQKTLTLETLYPDIFSFDVLTMAPEEILAEKVRAIVTRKKARDIFDLWFLLKKSIPFREELVQKKMKYYGKTFQKKEFLHHLALGEEGWEKELSSLISHLPKFKDVKKEIFKFCYSKVKN